MDKKKVTRRAAIGLGVGAVAAAPLIIRALRARYDVAMPSGTGTVKVAVKCNGKDIKVEVPRRIPVTPQEKKELQEQVVAQLRKYPDYINEETRDYEKHRDRMREKVIADYAEAEKRLLADLAKQPIPEKNKEAMARRIKEEVRASKARSLEHVDKLTRDGIARLSKP